MTHMQTIICLAVALVAAIPLAYAIWKILDNTNFIAGVISRNLAEAAEDLGHGPIEDDDAGEFCTNPIGFHTPTKAA